MMIDMCNFQTSQDAHYARLYAHVIRQYPTEKSTDLLDTFASFIFLLCFAHYKLY